MFHSLDILRAKNLAQAVAGILMVDDVLEMLQNCVAELLKAWNIILIKYVVVQVRPWTFILQRNLGCFVIIEHSKLTIPIYYHACIVTRASPASDFNFECAKSFTEMFHFVLAGTYIYLTKRRKTPMWIYVCTYYRQQWYSSDM